MHRYILRFAGCALCALPLAVAAQQSLYREAARPSYSDTSFRAYTDDQRAYRVGDSLTVLIVEAASASASANTQTDRNTGVSAKGSVTAGNDNYHGSADLDLSDDFAGRGSINRTGKVTAQMTVTVMGITNNGELLVSGKQMIAVNDEVQEIAVTGKVRPYDILANNVVLSSRLADAKISYVGEGLLAQQQRPGVISRFLRWLGL
jgi:flagellar L-ring protein precursor FlgH